ncbi:histidine kinase [Amycolatopsis anabasis]|uniref:histidine kinase n=1 Tax=Amycolatopsis anabasis TaxID=1840409 RepID=UPI00131DFDF2|nr:histidine kinase [Amycolatopsis anabasis]
MHADDRTYRLLVQGLTEYGICLLDPDGKVLSWNSGAERLTGYPPGDIVGRPFSVCAPWAERIEAGPEAADWIVRKDGTRFAAAVAFTAVTDERGAPHGFGVLIRELTGERRTRETERRAIADELHDDPVQTMVATGMRLQLLAGRIPEPDRAQVLELGAAVQDAVQRLRALVARLRAPLPEPDPLGEVASEGECADA